MMGRMSRQKGKRGEREAAKALANLGITARRSQQYCGVAGDSDLITDIDELHFEVKRVERLNLYAALEQAEGDRRVSQVPVVLHRRNGKQWAVIHFLKDWNEIATALHLAQGRARPEQD